MKTTITIGKPRGRVAFILKVVGYGSSQGCSVKKVFLKISQISQENTCLFFNKVAGLQNPTQMFSCEICEIFKNTYFEGHLRTTTPVVMEKKFKLIENMNFF